MNERQEQTDGHPVTDPTAGPLVLWGRWSSRGAWWGGGASPLSVKRPVAPWGVHTTAELEPHRPPAHEAARPGKEGPPPACTPSGSPDPCSVRAAQKCSRGRSGPGCGLSRPTGLHGPGVVQPREWGLQAGSPRPGKLSEGVITGTCLCPWLGVHSGGLCVRARTCVRWGGLAPGWRGLPVLKIPS